MMCGLLFLAASVKYMDRQVIGLLKPTLQVQFGWTEIGYSNIVLAFTFAYGASLVFVGKLIDRIGTRKGFSFAVLFWSISAMAHAAADVRFVLMPRIEASFRLSTTARIASPSRV